MLSKHKGSPLHLNGDGVLRKAWGCQWTHTCPLWSLILSRKTRAVGSRRTSETASCFNNMQIHFEILLLGCWIQLASLSRTALTWWDLLEVWPAFDQNRFLLSRCWWRTKRPEHKNVLFLQRHHRPNVYWTLPVSYSKSRQAFLPRALPSGPIFGATALIQWSLLPGKLTSKGKATRNSSRTLKP